MSHGSLIVLSGPSGVGKGTIYTRLLKIMPDLKVSVSATTRHPRTGEKDGVHYYFMSKEEFAEKREHGEFLEWAETVGNYYGTPKTPVISTLAQGKDILLEIDVKGARQIKAAYPDCVTIFVLPPSEEELEKRLRGRGTETDEQIAARLALAKSELAISGEFDHRIINDDLDKAVNEVKDIILKIKKGA